MDYTVQTPVYKMMFDVNFLILRRQSEKYFPDGFYGAMVGNILSLTVIASFIILIFYGLLHFPKPMDQWKPINSKHFISPQKAYKNNDDAC